ncbi:alkyl sulfatase dimerization domain-containing protein [Phenylobacterium sp.]|jgi:alkyl sulfatase BDS1-like metallo-beta-lactamase superfamily hydrolase|uniref:alkyl sulfatase dimerization domain-containing protein n=1 Tax=Phenylobacterium sp. TaxID=1871053 RepID=UPI0037C67602
MRSFDADPSVTVEDSRGQKVHLRALEQSARMVRRLYDVAPGVWTLVGNGLSNQTFIEGPEGVIAIDTGESNEEMASALAELRTRTQAPVVAVMYTHFHYVNGTRAIFAEAGRDLPVYGHERIPLNLARVSTEIAPAYSSGLIHQFGLRLPAEGPDGVVNVGLGRVFRDPSHAPFTPGHVTPTATFRGGETLTIAGLTVEVAHAPSDADDSVTFWFPALGVCVQNIVWPTLFNIFAIRGEEYRNPQVLLPGIDHVLSLEAEHLLGAHGPPLSGKAEIKARTTRYRDSIQFLWDQTVRGMNKGQTTDHLAHSIVLPPACDDDYLTTEFYGVAEHHVRQIAAGVRGWFDGDPGGLFKVEPTERAGRMVAGFGGAETVRNLVDEARTANDLRWALELSSWLAARAGATAGDRQLLADVLRDIASRTTAANIRNWCLTRARDIDGSTDLSRLREHRFRAGQLARLTPREALNLIRVTLDPAPAAGLDHHIGIHFSDAPPAGLHIRNSVSVATDGVGAASTVTMSYADLTGVISGSSTLSEALATGAAIIDGDARAVRAALACFEIPGFRA